MVSARKLFTSVATLAAVGASAVSADAQVVQYYTTGTFNCVGCTGSGSGSATYGLGPSAVTLTFGAPIGIDAASAATVSNPAQVNLNILNPSFASFGSIMVSGGSNTVGTPINGSFTLNIFQMAPTVGSATLVGSLTGTLTASASGAWFEAPTNTVGIAGIGYRYANTEYALVPATTNGGVTSLQGVILSPFGPTVIPEPSTYVLLATGTLLLGAFARRRRA